MNAGKHHLVTLFAGFALAGFLAGCGDDGVSRIPGDPSDDQLLDQLGIICESTLAVSGTFTPAADQPEDFTGCGGVGTWTVTPTVVRQGCDPQPTPPTFVYEVTFDADAATLNVAFPQDPANERMNIKITADGGGCIGSFEHFEVDNSVWTLQAPLKEDNTLEGSGTYAVHVVDPF